jgi:hypothetical protein
MQERNPTNGILQAHPVLVYFYIMLLSVRVSNANGLDQVQSNIGLPLYIKQCALPHKNALPPIKLKIWHMLKRVHKIILHMVHIISILIALLYCIPFNLIGLREKHLAKL